MQSGANTYEPWAIGALPRSGVFVCSGVLIISRVLALSDVRDRSDVMALSRFGDWPYPDLAAVLYSSCKLETNGSIPEHEYFPDPEFLRILVASGYVLVDWA